MISYKDSGVDKEEGYKAVNLIKDAAAGTSIPGVMNGLGSFASLFELTGYTNPVLVSGTDGVGTKLEVAFKTGNYDTVGKDCFAMCGNDILCHGARPLFFLDYLACGKLDASVSSRLVKGIADACKEAGCALVGGETAEMPGFYKPGDYDLAGFCVGVVEKEKIVNGSTVTEGDVIVGIPSSGLHSNGFSLVRKLITDYNEPFQGKPIHETLLIPTRIYVKPVLAVLDAVPVHGMAHITGGGLIENIPRTIPKGLTARIDRSACPRGAIFELLVSRGVPEQEMWGTFNMGIGFVMVLRKGDADAALDVLNGRFNQDARIIGRVTREPEPICFD